MVVGAFELEEGFRDTDLTCIEKPNARGTKLSSFVAVSPPQQFQCTHCCSYFNGHQEEVKEAKAYSNHDELYKAAAGFAEEDKEGT
ncbi:hypothetical protein Patl1_27164 [Pistacia atlantica]|uniref:Uncharacterized protein n=1 Tax=Pistacia atlantica TaxID=434234 RepID=A0ACC1B3M3_9ROSI|nr:hypothetical protein Patl1_27164 [Pistacia atlantica]